ncbi:transmembrane protein 41A-like [Eriocheir sinensis]|uniref:transmembrane protein 41A-like n=1 Tax=Eriocheir sinensis TaxID=95602 RepID=UPI0021CA7A44|nr:transmembrane protein 41A-like [Eriocheir sinensis]XP_050722799.1 transmembrane protein 41A-like [Eriocheir sinensis]XP_050722800.1 transmembrane protein 41A-like [Eriocheir sinensis]XP_050722801.1 transmembrane protein 41A-like [Eriocheir sinensis]XP_050722803.1 transmembrane protein 41A-like [Eriocheir sinensis]
MAGIQRKDYLRLLIVPVAFTSVSLLLWLLFISRPALKTGTSPDLHFPKSLQDLHALVSLTASYKQDHWYYVLLLFCSAYIYKQTFAIPGSALLNLLGGALFGCWPLGFPLCCVLTGIGASNCFLLSRLVGANIVKHKFTTKIKWLQEKVHENEHQLFLFLVSLRVFPMTPNWFLNVTAPYVDVPLPMFFLSVLIGLLPYNFLCVQAGDMLSDIQSMDDVFTPKRLLGLITLALVMFTLSYFARKSKTKRSE